MSAITNPVRELRTTIQLPALLEKQISSRRPWIEVLRGSGAKTSVDRRLFLIRALEQIQKLNSKFSLFKRDFGSTYGRSGTNILMECGHFDSQKKSKFFTAHYDVVCQHGENANDNSCSVVILLEFIHYLALIDHKYDYNIFVVFTDLEESGMPGARNLAADINAKRYGEIEWLLNLDMSGRGNKIFYADYNNTSRMEDKIVSINPDMFEVRTVPPNDAMAMRNGQFDKACIGLVNPNNSWETWGGIHTTADTWSKIEPHNMYKILQLLFAAL